jgi:hypothetical protein
VVDRFLLWLGACAVCAGVGVGMLAGAGVANAQTDDGDGGPKTSQAANPAVNKPDSDQGDSAKMPRHRLHVGEVNGDDGAAAKTDTVADTPDTATDGTHRRSRSDAGKQTAALIDNVVKTITHAPERKVLVHRTRQIDPVDAVDAVEAKAAVVADDPATPVRPREIASRIANAVTIAAANALAVKPTQTDVALSTPTLTASMVTASAPRIDVPPAISAIGTAIFGLISAAESVIEGPPKALPGSGVTVKRSTLVIGDQEVPADWYFPQGYDPNSDTPPERIIYLQHGFLARGVFYDYTASYLAEETNSIVVAPTLTSNIFATDGMWLGGDQMHQAAAGLFNDDNTALLKSAQAAGYTQDEMPQNVVLIGHSLGGGFVIDTARYMVANQESGKSSYYKLDGVVMMDGVSFSDPAPILAGIPDDIPVYNLSSTPNFWNLFGAMDNALAQVRGNQFHGAQELGGWHSDSMVGGNPLVQFGAYLLTGFPRPSNVAGSQILLAGWANDMFEGTQTCSPDTSCFYGPPGGTFTVSTAYGPAILLIQPAPDVVHTFAREVTAVFFGLLGHINFATDVPASQETDVLQELSA